MNTLVTKFWDKLFYLREAFILIAIFFLPISKAAVEIGVITSIILFVVHKSSTNWNVRLPKTLLISYLVFFSLCFISIFQAESDELKTTIRGVLKWVKYLGFFLVCIDWFTTKEKVIRAILVFLSSMFLVTLNGYYQLANGTDFLRNISLDPGRVLRMKSSLGAPNLLATFYLFAIPLSVMCIKIKPNLNKLLLPLCLIFISGLILTFSRAGVLGLLISVFVTLTLCKQWKWLVASFLIASVTLILSQPLYDNFIGSINFKDITIGERLNYWSYTWNMIEAHPLTGIGINLYHTKLHLFVPAEETYRGYAHNSYLQMWAEIGLLGLLSFLYPLTHLLTWIWSKTAQNRALLACLFTGCGAYLIQSFFDNNFFALQPAYLWWLFWGIFVAVSSLENNPS